MHPLEILAGRAQSLLIDNSAVILLGVLALWLITEVALGFLRHRDDATAEIAVFFGVEQDRVIPVGPGNTLFQDFARTGVAHEAATQLPPGAPSLVATYLIRANGGMTLVALHDLDRHDLYPDIMTPGLADFIGPTISVSGVTRPHRIPAAFEEDLSARVNIVEFLLKLRFGYPGEVRGLLLFRDADRTAPAGDGATPRNGHPILRITTEETGRAPGMLKPASDPVEIREPDRLARWFGEYAGRQTSRPRQIRRAILAALCVAILATGNTALDADLLTDTWTHIRSAIR